MPDEQIFDQKPKKPLVQKLLLIEFTLWFKTALFTIAIYVLVMAYNLLSSSADIRTIVNHSLADSAVLLIGFSFALSGICYFWNFADHLIIYRKQLGLLGFALVLSHVALSLPTFPIGNWTPLVSAILALLIYIGMALISNRYAIQKLTGATWRKLMRVGYLAYILTIIHFSINASDRWSEWFGSRLKGLPPFSLILLLFAIFVLGLRVAVFISNRITKNQKEDQSLLFGKTEELK